MYPATLRAVEKSKELAEQQCQFLQQMWQLENGKPKKSANAQKKSSKVDAAVRQGSNLFDRNRRARLPSPVDVGDSESETPHDAELESSGNPEKSPEVVLQPLPALLVSTAGPSNTKMAPSLKYRIQNILKQAKSPVADEKLADPKLPPLLPLKPRTVFEIDLAAFQFPFELGARDPKKQLLVENLSGPSVYIDKAYRELLIESSSRILIGKFIRMLCARLIVGPDDLNDAGIRALHQRREAIFATCTPSEKKAGIGMSKILGEPFITTITCFVSQNTGYKLSGDSVTRAMNSWKDDMLKRMQRRDGAAAENFDGIF